MRTFPTIRLVAFKDSEEREQVKIMADMLRQVSGGLSHSIEPGQSPLAIISPESPSLLDYLFKPGKPSGQITRGGTGPDDYLTVAPHLGAPTGAAGVNAIFRIIDSEGTATYICGDTADQGGGGATTVRHYFRGGATAEVIPMMIRSFSANNPALVIKGSGTSSTNLVQFQDGNGATFMRVAYVASAGVGTGRLLMGTTSTTQGMINVVPPTPPNPTFSVFRTVFTDTTAANGWDSGILRIDPTLSDASNGVASVRGINLNMTITNAISEYNGVEANVFFDNDDSIAGPGVSVGRAIHFEARTIGSGSPGSAYGFLGGVKHTATGTLSTANAGVYYIITEAGAGTLALGEVIIIGNSTIASAVTALNMLTVENPVLSGAGSVGTLRGINIEAITSGSTNHAIYSAGGQSYHAGNFGINVTAPTARLDLGAGTATAGTAPLRFNSGTSLTTAIAGAMEFTTDDLFFTITTGTARKRILFADPTGGLTSTRVPFATTNGRLTDDGGFLFASGSGLTLSALNIITDTTTGMKIGTAAAQKLGLWGATPIVQPTTAIAAATFVANTSGIADDTATFDGYTLGQMAKALRNIGALA